MEQSTTTNYAKPSLEIIFEHVKGHVANQNEQIATLDGKASFVLASSSLLTAGVTTFHTDLLEVLPSVTTKLGSVAPQFLGYALILGALGLYLWLVWCAYKAYRIRPYRGITDLSQLRDKYLTQNSEDTKLMLLDTTIHAVEINTKTLSNKALWTRRAMLSLVWEAIFIAALIISQLLAHSFV
jgi:hypothetical protein